MLFFFKHTSPTDFYTLSLHDALPIYFMAANSVLDGIQPLPVVATLGEGPVFGEEVRFEVSFPRPIDLPADRKSTRLNSSHITISYAVFCLKKKNSLSFFCEPSTRFIL